MGDYGFGVLVKNNVANKAVFPVRIHPHLQHAAPPSPPGFISSRGPPVGGSAGSAWGFPALTSHGGVHDDVLEAENPKAQQDPEEPRPLSPPGLQDAPGMESGIAGDGHLERGSVENGCGKESLHGGSPDLTAFDYQDPPVMGTVAQPGGSSSSTLTGFNSWSAAVPSNLSTLVSEEVGFISPAGTTSSAPSPILFQNFSHPANQGYGSNFSHPIGPLSQPHPHFHSAHNQPHPRPHPSPFSHRHAAYNQLPHLSNNKPVSPWGSLQSPPSTPKSSSWGSGAGTGGWGGSQGREYRRGVSGALITLNSISQLKKNFPHNNRYPRNAANLSPRLWMEDAVNQNDGVFPFQDRSQPFDGFSMKSLENSLMDVMRAEQDSLKARNCGRRRGPLSLFSPEEERSFGDDDRSGLCFPHQNGERIERYSRKVFVGGLPPDIDEDEIISSFLRFGPLFVDWPHKAESKSYFPPKGYAFLLFQDEVSVQALIEACIEQEGKLYLCVSSPTMKDKPVQIRPWNLNDSDFVMDGSQPLDPRKTIFVGGVPRPLRAVELAMIMDRLYGGVCYAGIDTDPELKYPKGAGRVAFSNQQSYIAAISARFVQLQHGDIDKRVEVKPYVLDDQLCDECQGMRCGGKFAPFFCANVTCLQYYCEYCWAAIHSRAGREFHKPLVKDGGDRPRHISFPWN
ncbi:cytoplasmic polyadenylation element-binding protein 4 isoform X2 [Denticeps clupeoides]|uniref:cytoplasmic polyadenylation element-binding protein 4 isoform X2 n=1 Tax=Denticeps clupeoides TaxID=299321 RepID=UPI0010A34E3C|nr:cytoplasmic polyadenylation element-binding protein 4-like isoform X2 [Denticeps clupeoides]